MRMILVAMLLALAGVTAPGSVAAQSPSEVDADPAPVVAWLCRPLKPSAGRSTAFEASLPMSRMGTAASYEWDFGDHSRVWTTMPVWSHIYAAPGKYSITLTVTDRSGSARTTAQTIAVGGREFMITFDDGPATESMPYILEQLRQIRKADGTPVKAGFFLVGQDRSQTIYHDIWQPQYGIDHHPGVLSHPDLTRQIAKEGHVIAIHTHHHPDLDQLEPAQVEREIRDCYQAILDTGITPPRIFRSPRMHDPKALPPALADWCIVRGDLTKDYLPLVMEDDVIENCRKSIHAATAPPAVLTFHDFRGLPGHRLSYARIVNTLTGQDGFTLVDFDADLAVAASRPRDAEEQAFEDLQDMLKVW